MAYERESHADRRHILALHNGLKMVTGHLTEHSFIFNQVTGWGILWNNVHSFHVVVEHDRSCTVTVTSSPLHIAAAAAESASSVDSWSGQSTIGCGTKTQPWMLEAPAGQRINISLLDFTAAARPTSQHLTRSSSHLITSSSSSSSGSCVDERHQYGYIIDKSSLNIKNVSVCHARSTRQSHLYLSTANSLQVFLTNEESVNFLLKVQGKIYTVNVFVDFCVCH